MKRAILFLLAIVFITVAPHFIKQPMLFAPVMGVSMAPVLKEGDLITYEKISPYDVEVGDIIVYNIPALTQRYYDCSPVVVHRVVEIRDTNRGLHYRTKGDNNPAQDPWSVRHCDIIGKVSQRISYLGFSILFLRSRPGLILIVIMFFASALCFYADELSQIRWKVPVRLFAHIVRESKHGSRLVA